MSHSTERTPGNVQQPAEQAKQAPAGKHSTPFAKRQGKPMSGNVAEPMAPNPPVVDLRSDKGDRRVNPQYSSS